MKRLFSAAVAPASFSGSLLGCLLGLLMTASGCGDDCTDVARTGLRVIVTDAVNEERICDADVTAFDGNFSELLFAYGAPNCSYQGASERPGSYTIMVKHPNYQEATSDAVRVESDGCHVILQDVAMPMTPQ